MWRRVQFKGPICFKLVPGILDPGLKWPLILTRLPTTNQRKMLIMRVKLQMCYCWFKGTHHHTMHWSVHWWEAYMQQLCWLVSISSPWLIIECNQLNLGANHFLKMCCWTVQRSLQYQLEALGPSNHNYALFPSMDTVFVYCQKCSNMVRFMSSQKWICSLSLWN